MEQDKKDALHATSLLTGGTAMSVLQWHAKNQAKGYTLKKETDDCK
jgi:hypothetical protein